MIKKKQCRKDVSPVSIKYGRYPTTLCQPDPFHADAFCQLYRSYTRPFLFVLVPFPILYLFLRRVIFWNTGTMPCKEHKNWVGLHLALPKRKHTIFLSDPCIWLSGKAYASKKIYQLNISHEYPRFAGVTLRIHIFIL